MSYVGIDFGTTNSAVAIADDAGDVHLVPLPLPGGGTQTYWRTVLYFEPGGALTAGAPAIARYVETQGDGRLVQSIKSHLVSSSFHRTQIFNRTWTLEDMIAAYLRQIRAAAGVELGTRCVIGRPVRYWGTTDGDVEADARAVDRMTRALATAGFTEAVFEYEPVGAAARYASGLDHDELLVVADFGGGTTDFSVIRVGPSVGAGDPSAILATGGIGISGDAFDARIIDAVVAPALGKGSRYRDEMGAEAPVPAWIYGNLRRWHTLSFLKDAQTVRLIQRVVHGTLEPAKIERLVRLVEDDLGLPLHRAVEGAKVRLSASERERVVLGEGVDVDLAVTRAAFEQWLEDDLATIDRVLDDVLARAGVAAGEVDRVFATGGTSLVPAVRARLAARFGADKLAVQAHAGVADDQLTSVAWGLAARARGVQPAVTARTADARVT